MTISMQTLLEIKPMMHKLCFLLIVVIFSSCLYGQIIDGWVINPQNASDPLIFNHNNISLHVLKDMGPVFDLGTEGSLSPGDYTVKVIKTSQEDGYTVMTCQAGYEKFSGTYTVKFKKLTDNAMELLVEGDKNVSAFQCGNMQGTDGLFKQFYTGYRDVECHAGNDNYPPMIYWPEANLYIYASWDADWAHGWSYAHRLSPKQNFTAKNPPVSCDVPYALLSDGTRPSLKERYVIRFATDMWEAYGPILNKPSKWKNELSEMVFFDGWTKFKYGTYALKWMKEITDSRLKFFSIIQTWGCEASWDASNPDAYRIPDHNTPGAQYGTKDELKKYISLAKSMGRVGLRTNYMYIGPDSWSIKEGSVKRAINSTKEPAWYTNFYTVKPLVDRQEKDIKNDFSPTATHHDQWGSVGTGGVVVNFDANSPDAGTISGTRQIIREICTLAQDMHNGPMGTESLISEFLIGQYNDTGDYGIMGADHRYDFTPEYKLKRLHQLTTCHSMGLGYRFFVGVGETGWPDAGYAPYFENDEKLDAYRACEVLYGNGAYLFFADGRMRKVHAMTECFTVGIAQRYYALQSLDYVKYSKGSIWKTLDQIIPAVNSREELNMWFKRFHIRYANGCNVWVNRDEKPLTVNSPSGQIYKLPKDSWLVYTEDGNLLAYTALANDPVVAGHESRVDFCEDKKLGIRYVNPRKLSKFMDSTQPTVWIDNKVHFVLTDPQTTFEQSIEKEK
ncbi:MAG: hypothetical protein ABFD79_17680 [Phycisphaerales bacterium]